MKKVIVLIILCFSFAGFSQGKKSVLLLHGYLHKGNGEVIESAQIGIREGKIVELKNSLTSSFVRSDWDTIVDLQGKHIYPGFIAPNSTLGLNEIDAVRATNDFQEVGAFNPHIRSQIAFNVESNVISTVRTNGVLIAQASPRGNAISGSSSVMMLAGWNWEDATILADDGVHVNWPGSITHPRWGKTETKKSEDYETRKRELFDFFQLAKAYSEGTTVEELKNTWMSKMNNKNCVFISAQDKDNIEELKQVIYEQVKEIFKIRYPYNNYLY